MDKASASNSTRDGYVGQPKTIIIGAGPVGALAALYAAQKGHLVEVYELRADLRDASTVPLNFTKSINLALSERGTNAIKHSGDLGQAILEDVMRETVPMGGRMIHGRDVTGNITQQPQAYDIKGRALLASDRGELNKVFLDALETLPNVKIFFNHKLTGSDFKNKKAWLEVSDPRKGGPLGSKDDRPREIEVDFDLMIGADGAHSSARYHMMKYTRMDYQQEYIDTLWCEFTIQPKASSSLSPVVKAEGGLDPTKFAISPSHLHIWPAKDFMFIAIPSFDGSFTCTLFLPSSHFATLEANPQSVPTFFDTHFPGVTSLIDPSELVNSFLKNPHLPLISIKCSPYHHSDCAVIVGDAAHAMVPFYGQGMNAGLEDIRILFEFLDRETNRADALVAYSKNRVPDAQSINELALQNYLEMRSSVTSPIYKLRKWLEETLSIHMPSLGWQTQYSRVSFGNEPYAQIVKQGKRQTDLLLKGLVGVVTTPVLVASLVAYYNFRRRAGRYSPGLFGSFA